MTGSPETQRDQAANSSCVEQQFDRKTFGNTSNKIRLKHRLELMDLQKRRHSVPAGIALVLLQLGIIGLCGLFSAKLLGSGSISPSSLIGFVLATFVAGSRFRALGNIIHECSHGTFVSDQRVGKALGQFLCFVDLTDFAAYKEEHGTHHAYLGDPILDLDFRSRHKLFERGGGAFFWKHVIRPLTLFHLTTYLRPVLWSSRDSVAVAMARLAFNAGLLLLAHFVIGWESFVLFYALPYLTTYQIFRYWSDAFDHAEITGAAEELHRARNHIFRWEWVNRLVFPRSDQYHLLHHLFPSLPTGMFAEAHRRLLANSPDYGALDHSAAPIFSRPDQRRDTA